jgi:hypothetical protein
MMQFAGRYANAISKNPVVSAVAGGLGAAGLATLGNIVSGQATEEGPGRLGIEALGAGALGATLGSQIPGLRGKATRAMRDLGAVVLDTPGSAAHRAKMSENDIRTAELARDLMRKSVQEGADPKQTRQLFKDSLRVSQGLINTAGIPLGLTAAGGLGGLVGGGVANAAGMVGIPGMQSNYVDPEGYGSSNSQMSLPRNKQTTAAAPTRYYS